jgi:hypothetical protein
LGFGAFVEMKHLFSSAPEARKGGEVAGVSLSSDAGCGCIGRWLRSHRTHLVANPRCCAVGRLHRRVQRFCIGRWLNTVQRSVPGDMARGRRTGEHRTRWCVRWWCTKRLWMLTGVHRTLACTRPMVCCASSVGVLGPLAGLTRRWAASDARTSECPVPL